VKRARLKDYNNNNNNNNNDDDDDDDDGKSDNDNKTSIMILIGLTTIRHKHKCLVWLLQSHASIFVLNHCLLTLVFIKKNVIPDFPTDRNNPL